MTDGTIMYFCELCGGSVDADQVPPGVDIDSPTYACAECLPIAEANRKRERRVALNEGFVQGYVEASVERSPKN